MTEGIKLISKSFRVNDKWFFGPVMASSDAMIMVVNRIRGRAATRKSAAAFAGGIGLAVVNPVVGMGLLSLYDDNSDVPQSLFTAPLGELPPRLTDNPYWPKSLKRRLHRNTIIVLNRSAANWKLSIWSGLQFKVGEHEIQMEIQPVVFRSVSRFLEATGWETKQTNDSRH